MSDRQACDLARDVDSGCLALVLRHVGTGRQDANAATWAIARWLLKSLCRGGAVEHRMTRNEHGKPTLPIAERLWFNLSHGTQASLIAISRAGEVGCDIEDRIRADDFERVGPLILHRRELQYLSSAAPEVRRELFSRCWVRKEALLKARGFGFRADALSVDTRLDVERPAIAFEGATFRVHEAPASSGIFAAVACVDASCSWELHELASLRAETER